MVSRRVIGLPRRLRQLRLLALQKKILKREEVETSYIEALLRREEEEVSSIALDEATTRRKAEKKTEAEVVRFPCKKAKASRIADNVTERARLGHTKTDAVAEQEAVEVEVACPVPGKGTTQKGKQKQRQRVPSSWRLTILRVLASRKKTSSCKEAHVKVSWRAIAEAEAARIEAVRITCEKAKLEQADAMRRKEREQAEFRAACVADVARMAEEEAATEAVRRTYEDAKVSRIARAAELARREERKAVARNEREEADAEVKCVVAKESGAIQQPTDQADADDSHYVDDEPKVIDNEAAECARLVLEEVVVHEEFEVKGASAAAEEVARKDDKEADANVICLVDNQAETRRHVEEATECTDLQPAEAIASNRLAEADVVVAHVFAEENGELVTVDKAMEGEAVGFAEEEAKAKMIAEEAGERSRQEESEGVERKESKEIACEVASVVARNAETEEANVGVLVGEEVSTRIIEQPVVNAHFEENHIIAAEEHEQVENVVAQVAAEDRDEPQQTEEAKVEIVRLVEDAAEEKMIADDVVDQTLLETATASAIQEREEAAAEAARVATGKGEAAWKADRQAEAEAEAAAEFARAAAEKAEAARKAEAEVEVEIARVVKEEDEAKRIVEEAAEQTRLEIAEVMARQEREQIDGEFARAAAEKAEAVRKAEAEMEVEIARVVNEEDEAKRIVEEAAEQTRLEAAEVMARQEREQIDREFACAAAEKAEAARKAEAEVEVEIARVVKEEDEAKRIVEEAAEQTRLEAAEVMARQEREQIDSEFARAAAEKAEAARKAEAEVEVEIARVVKEEDEAKTIVEEAAEQASPEAGEVMARQECAQADTEVARIVAEMSEAAWRTAAEAEEEPVARFAEEGPEVKGIVEEVAECVRSEVAVDNVEILVNSEELTDRKITEVVENVDSRAAVATVGDVALERVIEEGGEATNIDIATRSEAQVLSLVSLEAEQISPELLAEETELVKRARGELPSSEEGISHKKARHTSPSVGFGFGIAPDPFPADDSERIGADVMGGVAGDADSKQPAVEGDGIACIDLAVPLDVASHSARESLEVECLPDLQELEEKPGEEEAIEQVFASDLAEGAEFVAGPPSNQDVTTTEQPLAKKIRTMSPVRVAGDPAPKRTSICGGS